MAPARMLASTIVSALPPVAHPFQTLTNGTPVSPSSADERVGVAAVATPAECALHVLPADAGVGERLAGGVDRLLPTRRVVPSEGMDADADDGDAHVGHCPARAPTTGRNANVTTSLPSARRLNGTTTSSIGAPISSRSGSFSVSSDSTMTSPSSST